MRGSDERTGSLFSSVDIEGRVPQGHPRRRIRELANIALNALDGEFVRLYSPLGRPSIPPERLLRASLLQLLYSIGSERQLMERLEFDLLFRWFVGLGIDDPVWDATSFTKNRERVLGEAIAPAFLAALLTDPKVQRLLSHEHFTVDGTLLKAWASIKSFRRKDGTDEPPDGGRNGERDFRGEKRSNATHASTTAPEARLYRKGNGQESRLCYMGHVLMENRHGLAVLGAVTQATGTAERQAALALIDAWRPGVRRVTLGGDKAYDVAEFVAALRARKVTPHIAIDGHVRKNGTPRATAIDARITRHPGYGISQVIRKRVEEIFGWSKAVGGLAQVKLRGLAKEGEVHPGVGRLRSGPVAPAAGGGAMTRRGKSLLGRWRIVETDLRDRAYLDMLEPAHITFQSNGQGAFAFGCINASMRCDYAAETVFFTWTGFDENDEVSGEGSAELDGEDGLAGEISFHNGDEAEFKARRV